MVQSDSENEDSHSNDRDSEDVVLEELDGTDESDGGDSSDEEIIINPRKPRDSTSENVGDKRTVYVTKFGRKATKFHSFE